MAFIECGCGKRILTKTEWAGKRVRCPICGAVLQVPLGESPVFENPPVPQPQVFPPPAPAPESSKACPYCAETIKAEAIRCRFCGENLDAQGPRLRAPMARPGYRAPRTDTGGTGILVMAILGWVICQIFSPIAWAMGSSHINNCQAQGIEPSGAAKAGRIMGMIGTILLIIVAVVFVIAIAAEGAK